MVLSTADLGWGQYGGCFQILYEIARYASDRAGRMMTECRFYETVTCLSQRYFVRIPQGFTSPRSSMSFAGLASGGLRPGMKSKPGKAKRKKRCKQASNLEEALSDEGPDEQQSVIVVQRELLCDSTHKEETEALYITDAISDEEGFVRTASASRQKRRHENRLPSDIGQSRSSLLMLPTQRMPYLSDSLRTVLSMASFITSLAHESKYYRKLMGGMYKPVSAWSQTALPSMLAGCLRLAILTMKCLSMTIWSSVALCVCRCRWKLILIALPPLPKAARLIAFTVKSLPIAARLSDTVT